MTEARNTHRLAPLLDWRSAVLSPGNGLSPQEKLVGLALVQYASAKTSQAYPGQENLALDTTLSLSTVKRSLRKLEELGFVRAHKPARQGRGKATVYEITFPSEAILAHRERVSQVHPSTERVSESAVKGVTGTPQVVEKKNREAKASRAGSAAADDGSASPSEEQQQPETLYSTLLAVCGIDRSTVSKGEARRVALAAGELPKSATPELVRKAARAWPTLFRDAALTPQGISKNYGRLLAGAKPTTAAGQAADRTPEEKLEHLRTWAVGKGAELFADELDFRGVAFSGARGGYLTAEQQDAIVQAWREARAA